MPLKRPIGGSGDAEAAEALEHDMEMETEVVVVVGEASLHPYIVDGVVLPQPEPEVHTNSGDDSGNDSGDDSDNDGEPVSHLYPFMCQIYPRVSLVSPASSLPLLGIEILWLSSPNP